MGEAFRSERHSFSPAIDPIKMLERVIQFAPATDADALKLLRSSFPDYPLSMRVAALDFLLRRRARGVGQRYSPRYACRTRSSTSSASPLPASVMRPFSST